MLFYGDAAFSLLLCCVIMLRFLVTLMRILYNIYLLAMFHAMLMFRCCCLRYLPHVLLPLFSHFAGAFTLFFAAIYARHVYYVISFDFSLAADAMLLLPLRHFADLISSITPFIVIASLFALRFHDAAAACCCHTLRFHIAIG